MIIYDTSNSFLWHRPLRRNPFNSISLGILDNPLFGDVSEAHPEP